MRKVALVTGSATGIGRSIAIALAGADFDVAINYSRSEAAARETERLVREAGAQTILFKADVSQEEEVIAMIDAVDQAFGGRLDLLVNNAGTTTDVPPAKFDTLSVEDFDRVFAVNVARHLSGHQARRPTFEVNGGGGHYQHGKHRRLAPWAAAAAVFGQQGSDHLHDADACRRVGTEDPGQCARSRLDGG